MCWPTVRVLTARQQESKKFLTQRHTADLYLVEYKLFQKREDTPFTVRMPRPLHSNHCAAWHHGMAPQLQLAKKQHSTCFSLAVVNFFQSLLSYFDLSLCILNIIEVAQNQNANSRKLVAKYWAKAQVREHHKQSNTRRDYVRIKHTAIVQR